MHHACIVRLHIYTTAHTKHLTMAKIFSFFLLTVLILVANFSLSLSADQYQGSYSIYFTTNYIDNYLLLFLH